LVLAKQIPSLIEFWTSAVDLLANCRQSTARRPNEKSYTSLQTWWVPILQMERWTDRTCINLIDRNNSRSTDGQNSGCFSPLVCNIVKSHPAGYQCVAPYERNCISLFSVAPWVAAAQFSLVSTATIEQRATSATSASSGSTASQTPDNFDIASHGQYTGPLQLVKLLSSLKLTRLPAPVFPAQPDGTLQTLL